MGQALYRKYRSKTLGEILGQDHITEALNNALKQGRISHAYLFTGPRGVGKTSVARILAHQLNGAAYVGEDSHLDIIEIDAASTGGVDEVRELREKVYMTPASGKYKVYIIDEVHMMSTSAFNALLKTLEEPPAHVIFILATTEAHKLPATIISRTQRYTFRPIDVDTAVKHLRHIANLEKINITDDALRMIAEHSDGSFRDGIGMLDQASTLHKKIGHIELEKLLGIPSETAIKDIIRLLTEHDSNGLVGLLISLRADGYQAAAIAKQLAQTLRTSLFSKPTTLSQPTILAILNRLIDVPASHNPDQLIELILLEASLSSDQLSQPETNQDTSTNESKMDKKELGIKSKASTKSKTREPKLNNSVLKKNEAPSFERVVPAVANTVLTIDNEQWQAVLDVLKKKYNTLYGIIKLGRSDFSPGKIRLTFSYAFHQKRANDIKNKDILTTVLRDLTGQIITVECIYQKDEPQPLISSHNYYGDPNQVNPFVTTYDTISNIFGGGELLES
ncbi:MAG: DNA polymerase III subunit gamma/tau [Candidatus Saccharimonadales bacterium]